MIYERWFTILDSNGLQSLYYSDIRNHPFKDAMKYRNDEYQWTLEKRMMKILKQKVSIKLDYLNLVKGLPVTFTLSYKAIPILEYGGNYLDLNTMRNAIHMINRFGITSISSVMNDSGQPLIQVESQHGQLQIPKDTCLDRITNRLHRNYSLFDDDLISRLETLRNKEVNEFHENGGEFIC